MFESDQQEPHDNASEPRESGGVTLKTAPARQDPTFYSSPEQEEEEALVQVPPKKPPYILMGFGGLVVVLLGMLYLSRPKEKDNAPVAGDLGQGISAATGLRGHLSTQWDGNARTGKAQYQLRMEPIGPVQAPGFAKVAANPPLPMAINIRLLDQSGFALCGKQILFGFDPTQSTTGRVKATADVSELVAAEAAREKDQDMFQAQSDADGVVTSESAKGYLPCSADQYKKAYYWDFATNFPTVTEQAALVDPKLAKKAEDDRAKADAAARASQRPASRKPATPQRLLSGFVMQGDERAIGFDAPRGVLLAEGKSFLIYGPAERTMAAHWAVNNSLIHYRCDQHASCALTSAGGLSAVHARLNE